MSKKSKICCLFNYAPHYRSPIYTLMDSELDCDFYFGDDAGTPIKEMDLSLLKGFKKKLQRITLGKWNYFWLRGSFSLIFKPYKYYITSGGSKYLNLWALLLLSKFSTKKVYAWGHGIRGDKSKIQTKLDLLFYRLCDKVLLYGHHAKEHMIHLGLPATKLEVIYNSLDYNKQIISRGSIIDKAIYANYFGNTNPVILYVGRIQKNKKLDLLLTIQEKLFLDNIPVNLVFVGKDIGDNTLITKSKNSQHVENVWFYGPCYDEHKLADFIQQAKLCVSPGSIGLTAIHVSTYGLPIVTHDDFKTQMPEFEVIKDGINGSFYKSGNLESLYNSVKQWLVITKEEQLKAQKASVKTIDQYYNPNYQLKLLQQLTT